MSYNDLFNVVVPFIYVGDSVPVKCELSCKMYDVSFDNKIDKDTIITDECVREYIPFNIISSFFHIDGFKALSIKTRKDGK